MQDVFRNMLHLAVSFTLSIFPFELLMLATLYMILELCMLCRCRYIVVLSVSNLLVVHCRMLFFLERRLLPATLYQIEIHVIAWKEQRVILR